MNEVLVNFEKATGLGPTRAARLLGVAYVTYAQMKSGRRVMQEYHGRHIEALLLLPEPKLRALIKAHCDGET